MWGLLGSTHPLWEEVLCEEVTTGPELGRALPQILLKTMKGQAEGDDVLLHCGEKDVPGLDLRCAGERGYGKTEQ